jgi:hypothetical protein
VKKGGATSARSSDSLAAEAKHNKNAALLAITEQESSTEINDNESKTRFMSQRRLLGC